MLPAPRRDRPPRRLRGRPADPGAALRPPARRPLRGAAGAERLRRAAPLPLQPARPAAARSLACPTPPASTSCARSATPTGSSRASTRSLPVIVLSGRGAQADRIRGLERRRRRLPRRSPSSTASCGRGSAPSCAAASRAARARRGSASWSSTRRGGGSPSAGARCALARKEFALLRVLAADPTRVFSKQELLLAAWGFRNPGGTRTLDSHASRLRRKLDPEHGRYVINVWGVGYRLVDG